VTEPESVPGVLGRMAPDWARAMEPVAGDIERILAAIDCEQEQGHQVLPARDRMLAAFESPLSSVRVLILGQDPYPTPGHAMGLAFSVGPQVHSVPRSLKNILTELHDDLDVSLPGHGDLSSWQRQGVMLLNRVLTVRAGQPGSHRHLGWQKVTDHATRVLVQRPVPLVALLWGRQAQSVVPILAGTTTIESAHPSPLSARRGFFGSRPFSRANAILHDLGEVGIDWRLD
jgi:uracil-DNA glycosylase